ncbi:hypothetical protein HDU83_001045 [Entophlyctis luteolus]|nr:hypothetical protein HDU82_003540 [Entophlyctis luteolus]KAJ3348767.1 hypothetical protein HDU83_001045 [Entophlyctis luteolus]
MAEPQSQHPVLLEASIISAMRRRIDYLKDVVTCENGVLAECLLSPVQADAVLKAHMANLHEYNRARDNAQKLFGLISAHTGDPIASLPAQSTLSANDKQAFYATIVEQTRALIDITLPITSNLANISSLLYFALNDPPVSRKINWCGFYLTSPDSVNTEHPIMVLGPFQGRLACTVIPFGKGVCGTAAQERRSVLVRDVHSFPGHIACDSASESELVVPIIVNGSVIGVLDIDCLEKDGFNDEDTKGLESVVSEITNTFGKSK